MTKKNYLKKKERQRQEEKLSLDKAKQCQLLRISSLLLVIIDFLTLIDISHLDSSITNKIIRNHFMDLIKFYCPGLQHHLFNRSSLKYVMKKYHLQNINSLSFRFGVEDEDLTDLFKLNLPLCKVEELHLTYCDQLSDGFISNLIQASPNVKKIDLSGLIDSYFFHNHLN